MHSAFKLAHVGLERNALRELDARPSGQRL